MRRWLLLMAMAALPALATADEAALDATQESRYRALTQELRCLVCQNQNIADSNAPLAADLRNQVQAQIVAGRTDAEITRYLTDRYGDFVLYRPPFKAVTLLLWLGPALLVLLALALAWTFSRRSQRVPPAATVDPEQLKKLLDEQP
ncbi:MAG: cytochrome c-type biogenesis protein CcmH [Nevskiaceae bacterium]|nr:MAG: cytochrome c-type biogenesis protein CcmH [Nevskiaceae bacterium]